MTTSSSKSLSPVADALLLDPISQDIKTLIARDQAALLDGVLNNYPMLIDRRDINEATWLHVAANTGAWSCMDVLLAKGLDVNTPDVVGQTPLHLAVAAHHRDSVQWLLEHGADPNARSFHGATPTLYAAGVGPALLGLLVEYGGDETVVDKQGDGITQWAQRSMRQAVAAAKIGQHARQKTTKPN